MFKNVLIFGDSYSTFENYVPEGYAIYYSEQHKVTGVNKVTDTWWHKLITETDSNLILNNSWSGSTIGNTGYGGSDCSKTSSFLCRLDKLIKEGFFRDNKIDTVFVFGGTNDSWSGAPVGELQFSNWKDKDLFCVLPAVCFLINELKKVLPDARIILIVNTNMKDEITEGIINACKHFGVESVRLENIDKIEGHPTVKGMNEIKNQILNSMA